MKTEQGRRIKQRTVAASAALIIILTIFSRPFGILREILTAVYFGARIELDSFLLAASVPIFLCTILGGGLVQSIVPGLSDAAEGDENRGWEILTRLTGITVMAALPLVALNLLIAPYVIRFLFPPHATPDMLEKAVHTYRLLSFAIMGGMLSGLFVGAANTFHLYGYTTLRSIAYNSMIVLSLFLFHGVLGIFSLGVGILLAEYSQLFVVVPPLWKRGFRLQRGGASTGRSVGIVVGAYLPAVLLTGMNHVNYLVDRTLAMPLGEGCVSSLHYAWKLILLPASLLSVAFATPLLTFLSRHEARKERMEAGVLMQKTFGILLFFAIPVTFFLVVSCREIVILFYDWGKFDSKGVYLTSTALLLYAPGLPFQLLLPLYIAGFLSIKKAWIPVLVSLPLVPLNWFLDRVLMNTFSHAGIALSTSLVFFLNGAILYYLLSRFHLPPIGAGTFGKRRFSYPISIMVFFTMILLSHQIGRYAGPPHRVLIILELILVGMITMGGYLLLAHLFDIPVLRYFPSFIKRKTGED